MSSRKIQMLEPRMFRVLINLYAIAAEHANGEVPIREVAELTGCSEHEAIAAAKYLQDMGLTDGLAEGRLRGDDAW